MSDRPTVAVFRPDDERMARAVRLLEELGVEPIADPLLEIEPTGRPPRGDGDFVILTSKTGVELAANERWETDAEVCAIGESTADALSDAGYPVDVVPETFTSEGLVECLSGEVDGSRIEVARSDHGSPVLLDGLNAAGAYVHETILYRLDRPADAGHAAELSAAGSLDAALFTSSLTVEHFLEAADERGVGDAARRGLEDAVVGAIGPPTAQTAENAGITVEVTPDTASFESLARDVVARVDYPE